VKVAIQPGSPMEKRRYSRNSGRAILRLVCLGLLGTVAVAPAKENKPLAVRVIPPDLRSKVEIRLNLIYGDVDPEFQRLDAYLVKSERPTPVLVHIHGGGWYSGNKSEAVFKETKPYLACLRAGISVVSIQYRLAPKYAYPAQVEDTVRAVQYIRQQAQEWKIDPARIAATGFSAGAHLTAWVALHDDLAEPRSEDPIRRQSSRLSAFVLDQGPVDLTRYDERSEAMNSALSKLVGCTPQEYNVTEESRRIIGLASPITYVSPDDPPGLLIGRLRENADPNGEIPKLFQFSSYFGPHSIWNAELLARAMQKHKVPYERCYRAPPETHP